MATHYKIPAVPLGPNNILWVHYQLHHLGLSVIFTAGIGVSFTSTFISDSEQLVLIITATSVRWKRFGHIYHLFYLLSKSVIFDDKLPLLIMINVVTPDSLWVQLWFEKLCANHSPRLYWTKTYIAFKEGFISEKVITISNWFQNVFGFEPKWNNDPKYVVHFLLTVWTDENDCFVIQNIWRDACFGSAANHQSIIFRGRYLQYPPTLKKCLLTSQNQIAHNSLQWATHRLIDNSDSLFGPSALIDFLMRHLCPP